MCIRDSTMVIVYKPVTLVTLFRSYDQFYRAECITVSGFLINKIMNTAPVIKQSDWYLVVLGQKKAVLGQ